MPSLALDNVSSGKLEFGTQAPAKPKRNSFTPQLFKTFSQTDMELRKDAKVASRSG